MAVQHRPHASPRDEILYEDYSDRDTERLYALFRHMNRLLAGRRPSRDAEPKLSERARAIDPRRMSPEARYLMVHILRRQGRLEQRVAENPHWARLARIGDRPPHGRRLVLSERPTHAHEHFERVGIVL